MTKEERAEISRRNGAKSKGPKTEEGRRSIADANTTHGLYRNVVTVLDIESQEAFDRLREAAFQHWTPRNLMESQFVEELVDYSWRINRLRLSATVETNAAVMRVRQSITTTIRAHAAVSMAEVESSTPQGALQMIQRRINALMLTCGTYDMAGEFAYLIGLPCKSGVGGGIVAVVPDRLTLAVWSPALDDSGNSWLGMKALEMFVSRTGLSVF